MSFISLEYILLLITSVIVYHLLPKKYRWLAIFCTNIVFYVQAGICGLVIILGSIMLVYITAIILEKITKYRKVLCFIYVVLQVGLLLGFKYRLFADVTAPMAISFYTLTAIGYVIDVYRGKYKAQKNPVKLATFMSFFPLMVQGPICRYDDIEKEMFEVSTFDLSKLSYGITRIVYGFFKKLIIAERLSIVFDELSIVNDNGAAIALNLLVYGFYLYSDFSGGIDIAVGTGCLFGLKLPENFNSPFFAVSISDYWRRWHMSLGAWLRDYVFYPISFSKPVVKISKKIRNKFGNKLAKKIPIYISTVVVWFITGLWHGKDANFIVWGMLNAVVILVSYELEPLYKKFNGKYQWTKSKIYECFKIVRTFILMGILRMLDYNTISGYFKSLYVMITEFSVAELMNSGILVNAIGSADYVVIFIGISIMFVVALIRRKMDYEKAILQRGVVFSYGLIAVMIAAIIIFGMYGIGYEGKDFIYIRY